MQYKITVSWQEVSEPVVNTIASIFAAFKLTGGYAQSDVFKDTPYYSPYPNETLGVDFDAKEFVAQNTFHPGIMLVIQKAIESDEHSITITIQSALQAAYYEEVGAALADNGVSVSVEEVPGGELSPEDQALVDEMAALVGVVGE